MGSEIAPYVRTALRKVKGSGATVDDWKRIIEELDRIVKGKTNLARIINTPQNLNCPQSCGGLI